MLFKKMLRTVQSEWQKEGFPKLGRSQFTTLEKLNELGAMRLSDVADTIHVTGGAVTGISDKLIEGDMLAGFVIPRIGELCIWKLRIKGVS